MDNLESEGSRRLGVQATGILTPWIRKGDDLIKIVCDSIKKAADDGRIELQDGGIVAVTEAVVALSQGNVAHYSDVTADFARKYKGNRLAIVDPIQSRNRFIPILETIADVSHFEKIYIFMTYPSDEVGNSLISKLELYKKGIDPNTDVLSAKQFCAIFGEPKHPFTGVNYFKVFEETCKGKAEIILCNDFSKIPKAFPGNDYLVCNIHEKEFVKMILSDNGAETVYDMSQIMSEPGNGKAYNEFHGLYGCNAQQGRKLKLLPRGCDDFVKLLQDVIFKLLGVKVEILIFGDGAFKDPVGGIWELADPVTTLAYTEGLKGKPVEVKAKFVISAAEKGASQEELQRCVDEAKEERKRERDISYNMSLGVTPRRITDLLASLSDLITGSGDRGTPVVYISGYLDY